MSLGFGLEAEGLGKGGEKKSRGRGMHSVTVAVAITEAGVPPNDPSSPPVAEEDVHSHLQAGLDDKNIP